MGQAEKDFFQKDTFVVMGNTRRMRDTVKGLDRMGKTVYFVDDEFATREGESKFSSLADLPLPVDAAICDGPEDKVKGYVTAAADEGIRSVWINFESDKPGAVALAKEKGLTLLHGQCAVIWLPTRGPHHFVHRLIWKALGKY